MTEHFFPSSTDALADFLGQRDVAEALTLWADGNGRAIVIPEEPWKASGFTDAIAASLIVRGTETVAGKTEDDWNLVAKVVSASERREVQAHRSALSAAPRAFAARHLVGIRFGTVPVGSTKVVYFQDLAGGPRELRLASKLSPTGQAEAIIDLCKTVSRSIATEWNTKVTVSDNPMPVAEFAHAELHHPLSGKGSVERWASDLGLDDASLPWVTTQDGEEAMPNPVLLATGHPALAGRRLTVLTGHGHGDLHLGNIVLPVDDRGAHPDAFRLIDLSTYCASAPLARDQLMLLLSATALFWPSLSPDQRESLLDDLPRAHRAGHPRRDPLLGGLINHAFGTTAAKVEKKGWQQAWHDQYLLSLAATALRFTTFENMGPELRWWFLRLACRSAKEYFVRAQIPLQVGPAGRLHNPFGSTLPPAVHSTPSSADPAVAPTTAEPAAAGPTAAGYGTLKLDGILPGRLGKPRPVQGGIAADD